MFKKRKIIKDNNPILRQKSLPVTFPLSEEVTELCDYMLEHLIISQDEELNATFQLRPGVGLSAIQLGIPLRIFAIYIKYQEGEVVKHVLINPKIIEVSLKKCYLENYEGCLSVDKVHAGFVLRHNVIKIKAYDYLLKEEVVLRFKGYEAIAIQHEYDHLQGMLFYDRFNKANPLKAPEDAISI